MYTRTPRNMTTGSRPTGARARMSYDMGTPQLQSHATLLKDFQREYKFVVDFVAIIETSGISQRQRHRQTMHHGKFQIDLQTNAGINLFKLPIANVCNQSTGE